VGTSFGDTPEDILAMNIGQRFLMQLSISYKLKAARFVLARNLTAYIKGSAMTNEKSADKSHALALSNESIAEICLAYLLQFDKPDSLTSQTIEDPLALYAAEYWTQHARVAGKNENIMDRQITELFMSKKDAYVNSVRLFDPEDIWNSPDITKSSESVLPPLYYASLTGLIEAVRLLLEKGADVNAQGGGDFDTALQAALARGHDQIVQRLLEDGADVNAAQGLFTVYLLHS
jgi:hypothetical protein